MTQTHRISVIVNGTAMEADVPANLMLGDFLRGPCGLPGTKIGCDQGACGACTVLIDSDPVSACLTLAVLMDGRAITTIEGLAVTGVLDPVQQALHDHSVPQCGFCMPGMVMLAKAFLLQGGGSPEAAEIWMGANICRCTGYGSLRRALAALA